MRYTAKILIGFTLLAGMISLTACGAGEGKTGGSASLTLQTYTVPDGRARDLSKTLNIVLGTGNDKNQIGRTWFAGPGKILVLAPERMQDSIAASIKQIAGTSAAAAKQSVPVRLNAWIVDVYPGSGQSDPSLKAIEPALDGFSEAMGTAHFVQAHYLTAVSDVGSRTVLNPLPGNRLSYEINSSDGGLVLKFDYSEQHVYSERRVSVGLRGQVAVQPGQTLVLGLISDRPIEQSGAHHQASKAASSAGTANTDASQSAEVIHRLLVVRITPANQG